MLRSIVRGSIYSVLVHSIYQVLRYVLYLCIYWYGRQSRKGLMLGLTASWSISPGNTHLDFGESNVAKWRKACWGVDESCYAWRINWLLVYLLAVQPRLPNPQGALRIKLVSSISHWQEKDKITRVKIYLPKKPPSYFFPALKVSMSYFILAIRCPRVALLAQAWLVSVPRFL